MKNTKRPSRVNVILADIDTQRDNIRKEMLKAFDRKKEFPDKNHRTFDQYYDGLQRNYNVLTLRAQSVQANYKKYNEEEETNEIPHFEIFR